MTIREKAVRLSECLLDESGQAVLSFVEKLKAIMAPKCCDSDVKCSPTVYDGCLAIEVSTKCCSVMVTSCQNGGVKVLRIDRDGKAFEDITSGANPEAIVDLLFGNIATH